MMKAKTQTLGLYVHIPFCVRKCNYCDFYSAPCEKDIRTAYAAALAAHLIALAPRTGGYLVDTVYFGGGTPTLLETEQLCALMDTIRTHYALEKGAEVTVECNPVTTEQCDFQALFAAGIHRLSIGLQSIHKRELQALGRLHDFAAFETTLFAARAAGFTNISADVMFGIPHQTVSSFRETLQTLCEMDLSHISAYGLRVEENTPFGRMKHLPLPTEDEEVDMRELANDLLGAHGYCHYEISNYAKKGCESRHNLRYWRRLPYLGVGAAAHSFFEEERFAIAPDTAKYIEGGKRGAFDHLLTERHTIGKKEAQDEYVMLRMRLAEGVRKKEFAALFGKDFEAEYGSLQPYLTGGFLQNDPNRVAFTERGMNVSNSILAEWLDFGDTNE